MAFYKVIDIQEADYGCEECAEDGPHALLLLKKIEEEALNTEKTLCKEILSLSKKYDLRREVSEEWIAEQKIDIGSVIEL